MIWLWLCYYDDCIWLNFVLLMFNARAFRYKFVYKNSYWSCVCMCDAWSLHFQCSKNQLLLSCGDHYFLLVTNIGRPKTCYCLYTQHKSTSNHDWKLYFVTGKHWALNLAKSLCTTCPSSVIIVERFSWLDPCNLDLWLDCLEKV